MQKTIHKYRRGYCMYEKHKKSNRRSTFFEMFDKFMSFKKTEALALKTMKNYYTNFESTFLK